MEDEKIVLKIILLIMIVLVLVNLYFFFKIKIMNLEFRKEDYLNNVYNSKGKNTHVHSKQKQDKKP